MAFVFAKGSDLSETAELLLALAAEKGLDPGVVKVVWDGFEVPDELLSEIDKQVIEKKPSVEEAEEAPKAAEKAPSEPVEPPKRRGRPPGSHNKPKPAEAKEAEPETPAQAE